MSPYSAYALQFTMASLMLFFRPSIRQEDNEDGGNAGCCGRRAPPKSPKKAKEEHKFETMSKKMDREKKNKFVGSVIDDI